MANRERHITVWRFTFTGDIDVTVHAWEKTPNTSQYLGSRDYNHITLDSMERLDKVLGLSSDFRRPKNVEIMEVDFVAPYRNNPEMVAINCSVKVLGTL